MEIDDKESSPPAQTRKLKRLKKTITVSEDPVVNFSKEVLSIPLVDSSSFNDDDLESSEPKSPEGPNEPLQVNSESVGLDEEGDSSNGLRSSHLEESALRVKRVLEFGVVDGEGGDAGEFGGEDVNSDKKRSNSEVSGEKKSKRVKSEGNEEKLKASVSNKRREEKERREYLNHLHAESQRLLRETRDAAFKPVPIVKKPISSILEKIKQRKLELLKKNVSFNISTDENDDSSRDIPMDDPADRRDDETVKVVNDDPADKGCSLDSPVTNKSSESAEDLRCEVPSQMPLEEESKHAFRAPVEDTQDLYGDSQSIDSGDEKASEQDDSPVEEAFAPSLLAMNLKLDSAYPDDEMSSDEEDNDKENVVPSAPPLNLYSHPKGDPPVNAFLDDEAVEEDDSDNDLSRFKDNEEEDDLEDAEELKDMIATGYEEKPIDDEMRHNLHMKWLEQQDAFGTDKLFQKFGCGSKYEETSLLKEEDEREEEEDDDLSDDATEGLHPKSVTRNRMKKVKQMIPQMFTDKDDVYISSDDDEMERILVKQRLLRKAEDQGAFLSAVDDESSREVFGLIKKLNIVPDIKKKAKASSSLDMMSTKRSNSSLKSSFLGRASNNSLSSSHKRASRIVRSYIFERDDSRSAISMSDDSLDAHAVICSTKAKYSSSNSQSNSSSSSSYQMINNIRKFVQQRPSTDEMVSSSTGTSLFEMLKRSSSMQTKHSNNSDDEVVVQSQSSVFAAFKLSNKFIKRE